MHAPSILTSRLRLVGLVDVNVANATAALERKLASERHDAWSSCKIFTSITEAGAALSFDPHSVPQYVPIFFSSRSLRSHLLLTLSPTELTDRPLALPCAPLRYQYP